MCQCLHFHIFCQVKELLKADGYKIWMDVDNMGGSTLQAMAEAVQNASVVLVCMSERYKESQNCRSGKPWLRTLSYNCCRNVRHIAISTTVWGKYISEPMLRIVMV